MGDACHATLPYLAQGAAMAVEDGCMLGRLLEKIVSMDQILPALRIYENLRKPRTTRLVEGGTAQRNILHAHDGAAQEERDRVLLQDAITVGHPNRWKDPEFRDFMFGYDPYQQADIAWQLWQERGSVPSRQEIVQAGSRL
jgi:salicylate hydroxylase